MLHKLPQTTLNVYKAIEVDKTTMFLLLSFSFGQRVGLATERAY